MGVFRQLPWHRRVPVLLLFLAYVAGSIEIVAQELTHHIPIDYSGIDGAKLVFLMLAFIWWLMAPGTDEQTTRSVSKRRTKTADRGRQDLDCLLFLLSFAWIRRVSWWWYVACPLFLLWLTAERWAAWLDLYRSQLHYPLVFLPYITPVAWVVIIAPFLETRRTDFGRCSWILVHEPPTPRARVRVFVAIWWFLSFWSVLQLAIIWSTPPGGYIGHPTAMTYWLLSPLVPPLLLAWVTVATPMMERRVRRAAWRALVCYDCGGSLQGVTTASCPECHAALQRPSACPRCRYDVAHLASSACPECGQELLPPLDPAASPEQTRNSASAAASPIANTDA